MGLVTPANLGGSAETLDAGQHNIQEATAAYATYLAICCVARALVLTQDMTQA